MHNHLIIRIHTDAVIHQLTMQWCEWNQITKTMTAITEGDINVLQGWLSERNAIDLKDLLDHVVVFIPGTISSNYKMPINSAQNKHIAQVAPFMVEEYLSEDIELFHVAYQVVEKNIIMLSVIAKTILERLIKEFENIALKPSAIFAESQLFDVTTDHTVKITLESNYAHICFPNKSTQTVEIDLVSDIFHHSLVEQMNQGDEEGDKITAIQLYYHAQDRQMKTVLDEYFLNLTEKYDIAYESIEQEHAIFYHLIDTFFKKNKKNKLVNLRMGSYVCYQKIKKRWYAWRSLIYIIIAGFSLNLILNIISISIFSYKSNAFSNKTIEIYQTAFPKEKSMINLRGKLDRKLKNNSEQIEKPVLFDLLKPVSDVLKEHQSVKLNSLTFVASQYSLICDIDTKHAEALHAYIDALKKYDMIIKLEQSNQVGANLSSKLVISL